MTRFLTALPVYNEVKNVTDVLDRVVERATDVLVVDDGSHDGTAELLLPRRDIALITHPVNRGYGAALISAFDYAVRENYELLITIDCDGQHEPQRILDFVAAYEKSPADIISGSRYLQDFATGHTAPVGRRRINHHITQMLNARLKLNLTDAFCGFKAYRVASLPKLNLTETGYAMPLELWVQAACSDFRIEEIAVPLIYLDETRSFGGNLDNENTRLKYYLDVIERSLSALPYDCSKSGHYVPTR